MGNIQQVFITRVGDELMEKYQGKFTTDFERNKKVVTELIEQGIVNCPSKSVKNKLVGYISVKMSPRKITSPNAIVE
jgi:small subunit ribosomal protein S17e